MEGIQGAPDIMGTEHAGRLLNCDGIVGRRLGAKENPGRGYLNRPLKAIEVGV